jgi:oligopeptidase A
MPADNPLLIWRFGVDHGPRGLAIPFDTIDASHVEPAVDVLLDDARTAVAAIAAAPAPRSYDDTLGALERATEPLEWVMGIVGHLESVATSDALRAAYDAVQPRVAELYTSLPLDPALWAAVRAAKATHEADPLDPTRRRHLDKTVDEFRRHGAELDEAGKTRLKELDVELVMVTTKFAQNVLDSTNAWERIVEDEAGIAGLPELAREAAAESARHKGKRGWRFTLQGPSLMALMTYLDDRSLREEAWRASNTRATQPQWDNRPLIAKIVELRREKARLLGYADFADFALTDRMAKTGARAIAFVEELRAKTEPAFRRETAALGAFARSHGGPERLAPWDLAYWAEKQRKHEHDFDEELLRPYFPLARVLDGMFAVASRLYGVTIVPTHELPVWHDDVRCFRIEDEGGGLLGAFYVDAWPRETKRDGAWMHGMITGRDDGNTHEPHLAVLTANVMPPVGERPALLDHRDVETMFHEFGHLLHHCLSRVSVRSLGGTNVAWDFVELPSQIMENWCWERDALDLFARHWQSGETIPDALFAAMKGARTFRAASAMMRQLGFAAVDLALHVRFDPARDGDPLAFARRVMQDFSAVPLPDDYAMIASFGHLFAHPTGYAAGYYSYKWAEVLDADAFGRFRREGILSRDVGAAFRRAILERGDSADPLELFRAFMGREPRVDALLERSGLAVAA